MFYHADVEEIEPNHWVTYIFELPGFFCSATSQEDAVIKTESQIGTHIKWLADNGQPFEQPSNKIQVEITEIIHSWIAEDDYRVNAFFKHDILPLTTQDIELTSWLLTQSRDELLKLVSKLSLEQLNQENDQAAHGSISGTLEHIARAEWWYFDRLEMAFDTDQMPEDRFDMLDKVRANSLAQLPNLETNRNISVLNSEKWSARKIVRRMLWHERDHIHQIQNILFP